MDRRGFLKIGMLALAPLPVRMVVGRDRSPVAAPPLFSFGVVADVQYADKDTRGARHYRESLAKLERCVDFWNAGSPAFVIQLGDLVDTGGLPALHRTMAVYERARAKQYSVLGNHDFTVPREEVMHALGMPAAYYSFNMPGWRFVVLDGMNVSIDGGWAEGDPHLLAGRAINAALEKAGSPIAGEWNGAIGEVQRRWLAQQLAEAARQGEKVVVFCHLPVLPGSCSPDLLLWDHQEVLQILDGCPTLVAYLCGHDHHGGHGNRRGVHYETFPGMVEQAAEHSSFMVDVHADRLVVRAMDGQQRALAFSATAVAATTRRATTPA